MKKKSFIIFILLAVLLTIGLGCWQVQRYNYKIAKNKILAQESVHVVYFPENGVFKNEDEYQIFNIVGVFDFSKQILIGPKQVNYKVGKFVYTIFKTSWGDELLVNRGFISDEEVDSIKSSGLSDKYYAKLMLIKQKSRKWYLPKNDTKKGEWFYVDTVAMGKSLDMRLANYYFNLYQSDQEFSDGVRPNIDNKYRLFNPHLKYVYFWFSLALALLGMLCFYLYRLKKEKVVVVKSKKTITKPKKKYATKRKKS